MVFDQSVFHSTEQGKSNLVCPSGYTNRPTPHNVRLLAFLGVSFMVFAHVVRVVAPMVPGRRCALPWAISSSPVGAMDLAR